MQWCTANAFPCCLPATTIQKRVSLSGQQLICLVRLFVNCPWQIFCGCFCWAPARSLFALLSSVWLWLCVLGLLGFFCFWLCFFTSPGAAFYLNSFFLFELVLGVRCPVALPGRSCPSERGSRQPAEAMDQAALR